MTNEELYEDVYGDSTLYAGMLLAVDDKEQYAHLDGCVDPKGKIWRHPDYAAKGKEYINSSSRDMFMGVFLGAASGYPKPLGRAARYLKQNKGLLCPKASDNRNKLGIVGKAQIDLLFPEVFGFGWHRLLRPFLGLLLFIEAATVYKGYQVNLAYCTIMAYRKLNKYNWWTEKTVQYLRKVREMPDLVCDYLAGDWPSLRSETPHMWNRHNWAKTLDKTVAWPVDAWYFTRDFPSAIYCRWVEFAGNQSWSESTRKKK